MFEGFDGWLRVDDNPKSVDEKPYSVSELLEQCNIIFDSEFYDVYVEGEVASFKVNQGKWVFFNLKDETSNVSCFLPLMRLGVALSDGMRVRVCATPHLTARGNFSLTIGSILPLGEGNIKKSFEQLKKKLTREGIFDPVRKRPLPEQITKIGVISSVNAAGYHDFLKILNNRWGGLELFVVNTQVQGLDAPAQIIKALDFLNQRPDLDLVAILRGGGSAEDLAVFNDEQLVRAIAKSRLPTLTGIGHEIDESLADLAADLRASTPSNAAEILTPDRKTAQKHLADLLSGAKRQLSSQLDQLAADSQHLLERAFSELEHQVELSARRAAELEQLLDSFNPESALKRGYAIINGRAGPHLVGDKLSITTKNQILTAEVTHAQTREQ